MKILLTSPYRLLPANSGGAVRTISIAKTLAQMGHEIHVLGATHEPADDVLNGIKFHGFKPAGTRGHFLNPDFRQTFKRLLKEGIDLVLVGFPFQSWMVVPLARKYGVPLIYDAHNIESDRFRRMNRPLVAALVRMTERSICKAAKLVLTVSEDDKALLKEMYDKDSVLLPNGVDTDSMTPGVPASRLLEHYRLAAGQYVLFFGGYDYPPNQEAARFLLNVVWPAVMQSVPDMKLALVGRQPQPWMRGRNVVVTGAVDDLANLIRGARVVLAPLFSGGGTRLKIIEALSYGKVILATPFGAMGIAKTDSPSLCLTNPDHFAQKLIELIKEDRVDLCGNQAARQLAEHFDWRVLVSAVMPDLLKATGH